MNWESFAGGVLGSWSGIITVALVVAAFAMRADRRAAQAGGADK